MGAGAAMPPLRAVASIALPQVEGRIDHMAVDLAGRRLFVAALGNDSVEIVDLRRATRLASLRGMREPQGLGFVPGANRLFVANGGNGTIAAYRADSLRPDAAMRPLSDLDDADNVRVASDGRHLYVGYGEGALIEIDTATGSRSGPDIRLSAHPESFLLESRGPRIFVNVPNAGHVAVVDRSKRAVVATWPLADIARANFPMALDEPGDRLFVGCREPAVVLVLDTRSGRLLDRIPIGGDTDDLFWDPKRRRLYASCGEGVIDVLGQAPGSARLRRIGRIPTASGARTSLFVPEWARLYLAVPHRGAERSASIRIYAAEDGTA